MQEAALSELTRLDLAIIGGGYLLLLASSGLPIRAMRRYVSPPDAAWPDRSQRRAGTVIGKCENALIMTFVLLSEFTGLAVIFAAEGIVSRELEDGYAQYVLAGTILNFSYSILFGFLVRLGLAYVG